MSAKRDHADLRMASLAEAGDDQRMATLFVMVGLPGSGKTTRAKSLSGDHAAIRLSPDEWMIPLFGESEADGKRDVLEGRLISVALQALRLGTSVVLDFGVWSRDERSSLRWLAASVGASCHLVYVPIDRTTQLDRIEHRLRRSPSVTFPMTGAELDLWREHFDEPYTAELECRRLTDPPPWESWLGWATDRWPSLVFE